MFGRTRIHTRLKNPFGSGSQFAATLFSAGEQGFWYDHSDLSTLFQDSAGTVPVTAAGQPVGLKLDKSGNGNHAAQPTAGSRPILRLNAATGFHYLECDGVDDGMVTASIDFTGTDKISLFAGIRKVSDAARGTLMELSSTIGNLGTFLITAPVDSSNSYRFTLHGSGANINDKILGADFPAPVSNTLSVGFDTAALTANAQIDARVNGLSVGNSTVLAGAGTYGNYPLYLYRRGGTIFPFNGHSYGEIGVGRLTTAAETSAIEQYFALRTGVTLA